MLMTIPGLLDEQTLDRVRAMLDKAEYTDGKASAGRDAARVKRNEEVRAQDRAIPALNRLVVGALHQHPAFQAAAMPVKLSAAFFARYGKGMAYGPHIDDAIMGAPGGQYRSDISITVFLAAPESYQGGELLITAECGSQSFKLPAGDAVIYPSGNPHEVTQVASGERRVAVAWAQSAVRDPRQRELLYDLYLVKGTLLGTAPDSEAAARANRAYTNLYRRWAEL